MERSTVLSIGTFDGVHVGHRALIARAREIAGRGRVVALAFDPHPATHLRPADAPGRLSTFEEKALLLSHAGADEIVRLEPTPDLLNLGAEEFMAGIVARHAPKAIVEGSDFHFGRGRGGNVATLRELGVRLGFEADIVAPVVVGLNDQLLAKASSSLIRWLLRHARVRDAACVLGRPYSIRGEVVPGDRRGRTIGFPTANVSTPCMPPANGIYAGRCELPDGAVFPCAMSVGTRPTFDGQDRRIEVHVLLSKDRQAANGSGPIPGLPEYGWTIGVTFDAFLRDEVRFAGVNALVDQMHRDCARAADLVPHVGASPAHGRTSACP